ncbi:MAG: 6-bladed beta-propeller [Thermomicrobiales bacterium]
MSLPIVGALAACGGRRTAPRPASIDVQASEGAFSDYFVLRDSIVLEQTRDLPIVRVSGIDVDAGGRILLGDVSEGNVKLFDAHGKLLGIMGRKGAGPGEFNQPRFPRFGPDGRIYVADGQMGRLSIFSDGLELLRTIQFNIFPLGGFEILPGDRFLISQDPGEPREGVLAALDTAGDVVGRMAPKERFLPATEPTSPLWRMVSQYWVALDGDTAYVAGTLADTVWKVSLQDSSMTGVHLTIPEYKAPTLPETSLKEGGLAALTAWQKSFHIAATIGASRGWIAIPYVQGVLNYGDPMILVVRTPEGRWLALTGAKPVIKVVNGELIALEHPDDPEHVVLGVYRPR